MSISSLSHPSSGNHMRHSHHRRDDLGPILKFCLPQGTKLLTEAWPDNRCQTSSPRTVQRWPPAPTLGGVYSLTGNYPLANFEQEIADSSPCMTQTLLSNPGEVKESREKPGESQTEVEPQERWGRHPAETTRGTRRQRIREKSC